VDNASTYEGVLEHGEEEGYGLWLDPAVADDPAFIKGFSDVSAVEVTVERDRIVLREAPDHAPDSSPSAPSAPSAEDVQDLQLGLSGFDYSGLSAPTSNREWGRLRWYDQTKGFGFIFRPSGDQIFFHMTNAEDPDTIASLEAGDAVSYEVGSNHRGLVALDVRSSG
jgi:cold shock CspA family protein